MGDFNNDKITDIVTSGGGANGAIGNNVSVLLGKGDGTLVPTTTITLSGKAYFVVTADFNNDGNTDLAVGTESAAAILLGNGDGTFGPETDFPIPGGATALAVGDFNGDGRMDIAAGSLFSSSISVLLNTGGGNFSTVATYPVPNNVIYLGVGDFNADGIQDLAVQNGLDQSGSVSATGITVQVGNGDGTFQPAQLVAGGATTTYGFAIADFNGDGFPDIAVGNSVAINVPVLPAATLAPRLVAFGNIAVGSSGASQAVKLTNTSSSALTISDISIMGSQGGEFKQTNTCGSGLAVRASCTIAVTSTPTAIGSLSATLDVADNAELSPHTVSLSSTGISLGLGASDSSATVVAGQTASYTLSIGGGGFSGTVTLTCSGVPAGAQCSLPARENVSATAPVTFTVSVSTTPPAKAAGIVPKSFLHSGWLWALVLAGILILPGSGQKRTSRSLRGLPILLLMVFVNSCGGRSTNNCPSCSSGTPPGQYTVTVNATSGSISQSMPLSLTVH